MVEVRRFKGLRPLGQTVEALTRPSMRKRGFAENSLLNHWPSIVGPELAAWSCPQKLAQQHDNGGVLHIAVSGPYALEIQHLEPIILERIATYFGYRAVSRLSLKQTAMDRITPPPAKPWQPARLSAAEAEKLNTLLSGISDEELKAALQHLGESVLHHNLSLPK